MQYPANGFAGCSDHVRKRFLGDMDRRSITLGHLEQFLPNTVPVGLPVFANPNPLDMTKSFGKPTAEIPRKFEILADPMEYLGASNPAQTGGRFPGDGVGRIGPAIV